MQFFDSRPRTRLLVIVCSLVLPCFALSQDKFPSKTDQKPLWEFGIWGGEAIGKVESQSFGATQITMAGFHAARVIFDAASRGHEGTLEYTVEVQPLFLVTRRQSAYGGGISPLGLKWNFAPRGRYTPYVEFNGGGMFTQKNVPPGPTSTFNFTVAAGPGVMIAISKDRALSFALNYWHLSNANIGRANPQFNTIEIVVGYHWLKSRPAERKEPASTQTNADRN